jgi:hypothetical protein
VEVNARIFSADGIKAIKNVFNVARSGLTTNKTAAKLQNTDLSQISDIVYNDKFTKIVPDIMIDPNRLFSNRLELGLYLNSIIDKKSIFSQYENVGFWTWISALYLDQILEPNKSKSEYKLWDRCEIHSSSGIK